MAGMLWVRKWEIYQMWILCCQVHIFIGSVFIPWQPLKSFQGICSTVEQLISLHLKNNKRTICSYNTILEKLSKFDFSNDLFNFNKTFIIWKAVQNSILFYLYWIPKQIIISVANADFLYKSTALREG